MILDQTSLFMGNFGRYFCAILFPAYTFQLALLWMMILFALTGYSRWSDGFNSLGNILFLVLACTSAVVQIGMYYDVAEYTAHFGAVK